MPTKNLTHKLTSNKIKNTSSGSKCTRQKISRMGMKVKKYNLPWNRLRRPKAGVDL